MKLTLLVYILHVYTCIIILAKDGESPQEDEGDKRFLITHTLTCTYPYLVLLYVHT